MTRLVKGDEENEGPALTLIAGVGVMFENRRRNKFSGFVNERNVGSREDRTVQVEVMESLGNCPKYINTRMLVPNPQHRPVMLHNSLHLKPGELLPKDTLDHIAQADTIFLATRYTSPTQTIFKSHLGINHRGGKPGFLRITTVADGETQRQVVYLPDYSGNRFMSSLGNIHSDGVAGITIPLMKQGLPIDVVYLTGEAKVLLGEESSSIFPGVSTCVKVELTGFMHVKDAMALKMAESFDPTSGVEDFKTGTKEDGVGWSPYNPPIRRLRSELSSTTAKNQAIETNNEATITAFEPHTPDLATLTFRLSTPIKYSAGQHIILDCARLLNSEVKEYKHMSVKYGGEQELNDGGLRTWTISSAPQKQEEEEVKVTMRRVEGGLITPKLFEAAQEGREKVVLPVLGVGGDFVLPSQSQGKKMLWVASGVGVTPFLSFLRSLIRSKREEMDITLVLAVRRAEAAVMLGLVLSAAAAAGIPLVVGKFSVHVFSAGLTEDAVGVAQTEGAAFDITVAIHDVRLTPDLLLSICGADAEKAEAWVCGPPSLETSVMQTLQQAGWSADKVHRESFAF
ncbi:oxidoreductase FAD-binding protein [Pseudozyma hubeiensis SY62]|uniref:Oxidoreductase FAD-binding protein n=1 Tax=Pseudozyma hubeiensis (strain SY62) TaxID=1305764 RepID=R9PD99_PSEHS|nr:oxidoreductase FAD-binding protein [Pseudozyma hubeiensis SY62]GAC99324.1 oxidoreductase FAD-binding protein [Pseudozyma hubeiensis SY62]